MRAEGEAIPLAIYLGMHVGVCWLIKVLSLIMELLK